MIFGSYEGGFWVLAQQGGGGVVQDNACVATISRMLITYNALILGRGMFETLSEGGKLQEFIMPRAGANRKCKTFPRGLAKLHNWSVQDY